MIHARAANDMAVAIPFGAAHRVNFDTPPLVGNCPDTLVSRQLLLKTHGVRATRYLDRYRNL
jgi:hypothetical protein